ncbi:EF hand, partial [Ancylostoma duodenale]
MWSKLTVLPPNNSEPLKRPIHLDGIQLERDGELNKEFRQEVLLGGDPKDSDELKEMVKKMFQETDTNNDGFLSVEELEERIPIYLILWTLIDNSLAGPERDSFNRADVNGDGSLDPEEWLRFFHPEHNKNSLMDMAKDIFKLY